MFVCSRRATSSILTASIHTALTVARACIAPHWMRRCSLCVSSLLGCWYDLVRCLAPALSCWWLHCVGCRAGHSVPSLPLFPAAAAFRAAAHPAPPCQRVSGTAAPSLCGSQITNCSSRLPDSSAAPGRLGRVCFCSCVSYEARARCCLLAMHWRPGGNKRDERFAVHCHLSCLLVAWRCWA